MRNVESIKVLKVSSHVLDTRIDEPILATRELPVEETMAAYLSRYIVKAMRNSKSEPAVFNGDAIGSLAKGVFTDPDALFLENSSKAATRLFQIIKPQDRFSPGDLITVLFESAGTIFWALLQMEYTKAFLTSFKEDVSPQYEARDISLSLDNKQLIAGAFISSAPDPEGYDLLILEKMAQDGGVRYFMNRFCASKRFLDKRDQTRIIIENTEKFIRQNLRGDVDAALEARDRIRDILTERAIVAIEDVAMDVFGDSPELQEKYSGQLMKSGVSDGEEVILDKELVEKEFSIRKYKTDSGITIKGPAEMFDNKERFEIQHNGDGSLTFVIKGVRSFIE